MRRTRITKYGRESREEVTACNFIKKETLAQEFSCEFCEICKNTFFTKHLWTNASGTARRNKKKQGRGRLFHFWNGYCKKTLEAKKYTMSKRARGGSRTAATSKMEHFLIIVNGWKPLTIITKNSILNVAAVLDPSLRALQVRNQDY